MRAITVITFCVAAALPATAQLPIGHATPVGGYAPALLGEPLWLGNPGYGYRIQGAPPLADVFIVLSAQRTDQLLGALALYPSLAGGDIIVTHSGVADANGRAAWSLPLVGPEIPALAGVLVYAQAAVADPSSPGTFGTSEGLLLEVVHHPMCAVASFTVGLTLLDPVGGTAIPVAGLPTAATANDAVFANGGRDLFVASGSGLYVVDTLAATPTATPLLPGSWSSVAWDRVHRRVYALNPAQGLLAVLSGDRATASFGAMQTQVSDPATFLAISADGTLLALSTLGGALERRDVDPASANYLQLIPTPPSPVPSGTGYGVGRVRLSPDGRVASILSRRQFTAPNSLIHRFDGVTGQWIDHDATTPGYQPLSAATNPTIPQLFTELPARDGSALVLVGTTSVARVDLDLYSPAAVTVTALPVAAPGAGKLYDGLTPSGRFLVELEYGSIFAPVPSVLSLVDVVTGGVTPWVTLPATPSTTAQALIVWR